MGEPFDPSLEQQILEESEALNVVREGARVEFTPERLAELERVVTDFPWLPGDAADGIVAAGLRAGDPETRLLAGAAFAEAQELGLAGMPPRTPQQEKELVRELKASTQAEFVAQELPRVASESRSPGLVGRVQSAAGSVAGAGMDALAFGASVLGAREGQWDYEQVIKPAARGAFTIMEAPVQFTHGYVSALHDSVVEEGWASTLFDTSGPSGFNLAVPGGALGQFGAAPLGQTDLGAFTAEALETGELPDLGKGFFADPESQVGQRRQTERMQFQQIGGEAFTIGRFLADQVSEPGTRPYAILSGLTDLSLELTGPGATFDHMFLAGRARRTIDPENAQAWLNSSDGGDVMEALAGSSSFDRIDRALGYQASPETVQQIVESSDASEIASLIRPELGIEVTSAPKAPRFDFVRDELRTQLPSVARFFDMVPENTLSITDSRRRVDAARGYLKNSKATPDEVDYFLSRMATASGPTQVRLIAQDMVEYTALRAYEDTLPKGTKIVDRSDVARTLENRGLLGKMGPEHEAIRRISRLWSRDSEQTRAFWLRELEDGSGAIDADFWGEGKASPQAIAELLSDNVPLPDFRDMREMFASPAFEAFMKVPGSGYVHKGADLLAENLMNVWKAGRLLRIAWPLKVLPEGQLRLAMFGFSGLFNSPLDYLAYATKRGGRGSKDVFGSWMSASDEMQQAMFQTADVTRIGAAQQRIYADSWQRYHNPARHQTSAYSHEEFARHYADTLNRLSAGGEFQMYLRAGSFDEASETFWNQMPGARQNLQAGRPSDTRNIVDIREDADAYLRENVVARIEEMTGGDPELLEMFRTRKLDGHDLVKKGQTKINPKFVEALAARTDRLPGVIAGRTAISAEKQLKSNGFVDRMFSFLMSTPSNKLDRSPLFKQQYWRSIERLALQLDPADAIELMRGADAANLSRRQRGAIASRASRTPPDSGRVLTLEEADLLAKSDGLKTVQDVLYDAAQRNQFFDINRHVFPFGDAFYEVLSRWARIFRDNPNRIRKVEAVEEHVGGVFSENQYGDETFNIPMSQQLLSLVGVDRLSMRGYKSGLSIASEMWPGYGPVVQVPAAMVLPDDESFQDLREHLSSGFGLPPNLLEDPAGVLADTLVPPWIKRLVQATTGTGLTIEDRRVFANLVGDIAMSKIADDPNWQIAMNDETMAALLDESRRDAQIAFALRTVTTFAIPGAPTFEMTTDVTGETLAMWAVEEEYRRLSDEMGPNAAAVEFVSRYGADAMAIHSPASRDLTSGGGMPVHRAGVNWVRENDFVRGAYPEVYGFFAPPSSDDSDDFVYDVYASRFTGSNGSVDPESQHLTPAQRVGLLQDFRARQIYADARESVLALNGGKATVEVQEYLRSVRTELEEQYPGYRGVPGVGERVSAEDQVAQLQDAANDPRLQDNPLTAQLDLYFQARDYASSLADGAGFQTGKGDAYLRTYVYDVGSALAEDDPQFAEVWERALYREFRSQHEADSRGE